MSEPVQHPRVGELAIYQGVYLPHWEVGHIRVRVPRTKKLLVAAAILTGLGAAYWLGWVNLIELNSSNQQGKHTRLWVGCSAQSL